VACWSLVNSVTAAGDEEDWVEDWGEALAGSQNSARVRPQVAAQLLLPCILPPPARTHASFLCASRICTHTDRTRTHTAGSAVFALCW